MSDEIANNSFDSDDDNSLFISQEPVPGKSKVMLYRMIGLILIWI